MTIEERERRMGERGKGGLHCSEIDLWGNLKAWVLEV